MLLISKSMQIFGLQTLTAATYFMTLLHLMTAAPSSELYVKASTIGPTGVGTPPLDVTDFSCIDYNLNYIGCSFIAKNAIFTSYKVAITDDVSKRIFPCYGDRYDINLKRCNITEFTWLTQIFEFNLTGSNSLGNNSQLFRFRHAEILVPSVGVKNVTITSNNITFYLYMDTFTTYTAFGELDYKIIMKPSNFEAYTENRSNCCIAGTCNITIDLQYPNRYYEYSVSMRLHSAKDMWSTPYKNSFISGSRRPDFPPETVIGGYYIESNSKNVRLYWKLLKEHEHNGNNFLYKIYQIIDGTITQTNFTNQTSFALPWNTRKKSVYHIKAINSEGESLANSTIQVYPHRNNNVHYSPDDITKLRSNDRYIMEWKPPRNTTGLSNYTIFWCLSKTESQNECRSASSINFDVIPNINQTSYSLDFGDDTSVSMAISANYIDYNTGMHWTACAADVSSDLKELKPTAEAKLNGSIFLHWYIGIICPPVIKGFNISYCELKADNTTELCKNISLQNNIELRQFTINDVKAFTYYSVSMIMYSDQKVGPRGDAIIIRTAEAAPSAPRNLQVVNNNITTNSVVLSWQPPAIKNGIITNYTIWGYLLGHKNPIQLENINVTANNFTDNPNKTIEWTLDNLSSYTNYTICVTAHTMADSKYSNNITILTLIGVPSNPLDVMIIENYGTYNTLRWKRPQVPSGRVDFYKVVMIKRMHKKVTGKNVIETTYSLVKDNYCQYSIPADCTEYSFVYYFQVLAVNKAKRGEFDTKLAYKANHLINYTQDTTLCTNGFKESIDLHDKNIRLYLSPLNNSTSTTCTAVVNSKGYYIATIVVCVVFASAILFYVCHNKFKKMKNIDAILPEGLEDHQIHFKIGAIENSCSSADADDEQCSDKELSSNLLGLNFRNAGNKARINTNHNANANTETNKQNSFVMPFNDEALSSKSTDSLELNGATSVPSSCYTPMQSLSKNSSPCSEYQSTTVCQTTNSVPKKIIPASIDDSTKSLSSMSDETCLNLDKKKIDVISTPSSQQYQTVDDIKRAAAAAAAITLAKPDQIIVPANSSNTDISQNRLKTNDTTASNTNMNTTTNTNTNNNNTNNNLNNGITANINRNDKNLIAGYVKPQQLVAFGQLFG